MYSIADRMNKTLVINKKSKKQKKIKSVKFKLDDD